MKWVNKATPRALRLSAKGDNKYYEIGCHYQFNKLFLDVEDTIKGVRLKGESLSVGDLLKRFPELVEFENTLYAFEEVAFLRKKVQKLEEEVLKYKPKEEF